MGGISNLQRKRRAVAEGIKEAKKIKIIDSPYDKEVQNDVEPHEIPVRTKLKAGRKKVIVQTKPMTRRQATEKELNQKRTQKAREKLAEVVEYTKKLATKRRQNCDNFNEKLKSRRLEEENKKLKEQIESANVHTSVECQPGTSSYTPLLICTKDTKKAQSAPTSPTEARHFDFQRPVSAPPTLNAEACTRIKNICGLSEGKYKTLTKEMASNGINMKSVSTVKRLENGIYDSFYRNSKSPDFYGLLEEAIDKYDFSSLPYIRITIAGDKGGNSVKIGFFFNDVAFPLSVKKFIIIHTFVGDESREMLEGVMKKIDDDILRLKQNGIKTKHGLKHVVITYVGDCKYQSTSLGLQGGSAVCGCVHCISKRSEWINLRAEDVTPRTIESIISSAFKVINENGLSRLNESVKNYPLLKNIPISHFVPPPVHILITLVNSIIDFVKKFADDCTALKTFISATGVTVHYPAQAYEGNQCRKILSHFREENPKRIVYAGFGADLFEAASNIERYAVARTLSEEEIDALDSYIKLFFNLLNEYGEDAKKFFLNKTKIHMLQHHVMPFVRFFKSWGLFSEESGESIHGVRNELDRRIPGFGPIADEKRNEHFKKNRAIAFRLG